MSDDIKIRNIIVDKYMNDSDVTGGGQLEPGRLEFKWQFVKPDGTSEELRQYFQLTDADFIEVFKIKIKNIFKTRPTSGDHTIKVEWELEKGTIEDLKDYKVDLKRKTATGWEDVATDIVGKNKNAHPFRGTFTGEYVVSVSARGVDDRILGSESSRKVFFEYSALIEFIDKPEPRYYKGNTLVTAFNIIDDPRFYQARKLTLVLLKKQISGLLGRETYEKVKDLMAWEGDELVAGRKDFSVEIDFDYGDYKIAFEFEGDDERVFGVNPEAKFEVYVKEANPLKIELNLTSESVYKAGKWPLKVKIEGDPKEFNIDKLLFEAKCQKDGTFEEQEFDITGDDIVEGEIEVNALVEIGPSEQAAVKVYALSSGSIINSDQTPDFEIKDEGEVTLGFVDLPERFYAGESEKIYWTILNGGSPVKYNIEITEPDETKYSISSISDFSDITFSSEGKGIIKVTGLKADGTEMTWPLEKEVDVINKVELDFEYTGERTLFLGELASMVKFKINAPVPDDVDNLWVYLSKTDNFLDGGIYICRLDNIEEGEFVAGENVPEDFGEGSAKLIFVERRNGKSPKKLLSVPVQTKIKKDFELEWISDPNGSMLLLSHSLSFSWRLLQGDYKDVSQYVVDVYKKEGDEWIYHSELSHIIENPAQTNGTLLIPSDLGKYKVMVKLFSYNDPVSHKAEKSFEFEVIPSDRDFNIEFVEVPPKKVEKGSLEKVKVRIVKGRGFERVKGLEIGYYEQTYYTLPGYGEKSRTNFTLEDLNEQSEFEFECIADKALPVKFKVTALSKNSDDPVMVKEYKFTVEELPEDVVLKFTEVPEVIPNENFDKVKFMVGPKANLKEGEKVTVEVFWGHSRRIGTIFGRDYSDGNISGIITCWNKIIFDDGESFDVVKYDLLLKRYWKDEAGNWNSRIEDFRMVNIVEKEDGTIKLKIVEEPQDVNEGEAITIKWDVVNPEHIDQIENFAINIQRFEGLDNELLSDHLLPGTVTEFSHKFAPGEYQMSVAFVANGQNDYNGFVYSRKFKVEPKRSKGKYRVEYTGKEGILYKEEDNWEDVSWKIEGEVPKRVNLEVFFDNNPVKYYYNEDIYRGDYSLVDTKVPNFSTMPNGDYLLQIRGPGINFEKEIKIRNKETAVEIIAPDVLYVGDNYDQVKVVIQEGKTLGRIGILGLFEGDNLKIPLINLNKDSSGEIQATSKEISEDEIHCNELRVVDESGNILARKLVKVGIKEKSEIAIYTQPEKKLKKGEYVTIRWGLENGKSPYALYGEGFYLQLNKNDPETNTNRKIGDFIAVPPVIKDPNDTTPIKYSYSFNTADLELGIYFIKIIVGEEIMYSIPFRNTENFEVYDDKKIDYLGPSTYEVGESWNKGKFKFLGNSLEIRGVEVFIESEGKPPKLVCSISGFGLDSEKEINFNDLPVEEKYVDKELNISFTIFPLIGDNEIEIIPVNVVNSGKKKELFVDIKSPKREYDLGEEILFEIEAFEKNMLGIKRKVPGTVLSYYTVKDGVRSSNIEVNLDDILDNKGIVKLPGPETDGDIKYSLIVRAENYETEYLTPYDFVYYIKPKTDSGEFKVDINAPEKLEVGQNWNLVSIDVSGSYDIKPKELFLLTKFKEGDDNAYPLLQLDSLGVGNKPATSEEVTESEAGEHILRAIIYNTETGEQISLSETRVIVKKEETTEELKATINAPEKLEVGQNWNAVTININESYTLKTGEKLVLLKIKEGTRRGLSLLELDDVVVREYNARDEIVTEEEEGDHALSLIIYDVEKSTWSEPVASIVLRVVKELEVKPINFVVTPTRTSFISNENVWLNVEVSQEGTEINNVVISYLDSNFDLKKVNVDIVSGKGNFPIGKFSASEMHTVFIELNQINGADYTGNIVSKEVKFKVETATLQLTPIDPQVLVGDMIKLRWNYEDEASIENIEVKLFDGENNLLYSELKTRNDWGREILIDLSKIENPIMKRKNCKVIFTLMNHQGDAVPSQSNLFDIELVDLEIHLEPRAKEVLENREYKIKYHATGTMLGRVARYTMTADYLDNLGVTGSLILGDFTSEHHKASVHWNAYEAFINGDLGNAKGHVKLNFVISAYDINNNLIGLRNYGRETYIIPEMEQTTFEVKMPEPGIKENEELTCFILVAKGVDEQGLGGKFVKKGYLNIEINGEKYTTIPSRKLGGNWHDINFGKIPAGDYQFKFWLEGVPGFSEDNAILKEYKVLPRPIEISNITATYVSENVVEIQWDAKGKILSGTIIDQITGKMIPIVALSENRESNRARLKIGPGKNRVEILFDLYDSSAKKLQLGPFEAEIQHEINKEDHHKVDPTPILNQLIKFVELRDKADQVENDWQGFELVLDGTKTGTFKPEERRIFVQTQERIADVHTDLVSWTRKFREIDNQFTQVLGEKLQSKTTRYLAELLSNFEYLEKQLAESLNEIEGSHTLTTAKISMLKRLISSNGERAKEGEIDLLQNAIVEMSRVTTQLPELMELASTQIKQMSQP